MSGDEWLTAPPGPVAGPTIWRIDLALDAKRRERCRAVLSEAERARAERNLRAEDRDRFLASHAALRLILAGALGTQPAALVFEVETSGKPRLAGSWRGCLDFSLSHSGGWALAGLSPASRIGVDVEALRPLPDCLRIARAHYAPSEVFALARLPADELHAAFFACWTRKEAFVKALGLGLAMPLDRFAVSIPPSPAALLAIDGAPETARRWSLRHLDPAPGHVGAIALEEADAACALRSLRPNWAEFLA